MVSRWPGSRYRRAPRASPNRSPAMTTPQTGRHTYIQPMQGGPKKRGHRLVSIILSNLNRLKKVTGKFLGKFAIKWILKIQPHLAYVATLPCETLVSAKQAINDKLQGSVATYLMCGGVVNNQIKKDLLLTVRVKFFKL